MKLLLTKLALTLGYGLFALTVSLLSGAAAGWLAIKVPCEWFEVNCGYSIIGWVMITAVITTGLVSLPFVAKWPALRAKLPAWRTADKSTVKP